MRARNLAEVSGSPDQVTLWFSRTAMREFSR